MEMNPGDNNTIKNEGIFVLAHNALRPIWNDFNMDVSSL